jgi:hypothetical protein
MVTDNSGRRQALGAAVKCMGIAAAVGLLSAMMLCLGCTSASPVASPLSPVSPITAPSAEDRPGHVLPLEAPTPQPGRASLSGVLYSFTMSRTVPGTAFYLTPAVGDARNEPPSILSGPRPGQSNLQGQSDDSGRIVLDSVPPGKYYLAVWAPYSWVLAARSDSDVEPQLISLENGQRLNLDVIYLSWP